MRIFSPIFVSFSNLVLSIHMHWLFWRESTYSNILCIPVVNLFACTCTEGLIITSLGHRGLTYAIFWLYAMSVEYGSKYIPTQHRSGLKNLQHMYWESQLATAASVSHVASSLTKGRKGTGSQTSWPLVGNSLALFYRKELNVALQWQQVHMALGLLSSEEAVLECWRHLEDLILISWLIIWAA